MEGLFVLDTVGFINYFKDFFNEDERLSIDARELINNCFDFESPNHKLSIPSVVFIEIFEKFLKGQEKVSQFRYEIFSKIENNPDIEIKSIDKEVLEHFCSIDDDILKLEFHDKIITASALQLEAAVITCDSKIIDYIKKAKKGIKFIF